MNFWLLQGDATRLPLADKSVDLVVGSPPYEAQRTYGIGFDLKGQDWVDFMVTVFRESLRVCRGLVVMVVEGFTRNYRWSATPALLLADLHRAGINLRKPAVFHRVGIPGSGGPDWLRNDWEWIICASGPGKLPWSCNTAMGHIPKWGPGGAMSNRLSDGSRVNQWGKNGSPRGMGNKDKHGEIDSGVRPSHRFEKVGDLKKNAFVEGGCGAPPPAIANPGNVLACKVGGGLMGHSAAHENEAPYPEKLPDFFIRTFCPPNGITLDPFCGSGTTIAAAVKAGRNGIGLDVRESQLRLTARRMADVEPLFRGIGSPTPEAP